MSAVLHSRRAFSGVDLLTATTVVGLIFAMLQPALQQDREAARRTQCVNNLKTIGLAIHNYHDARKEICPSYLATDLMPLGPCNAEGYATWTILILPYMQQAALYNLIDLKKPLTTRSPAVNLPEAHENVRATSIPTYFCPSRRTPPQLTAGGEGSVGDYASVSYAEAQRLDAAGVTPVNRGQPRTFDGAMVVCRAFNAGDGPNKAPINGFQPGTLKAGDYRSMTSFASVLDGLSNTALIGEKAIHEKRLGKGGIAGDEQDGTIYFGVGPTKDSYTAPGPLAWWSRRLAQEKERVPILPANPMTENPDNRFGGWHPEVTLFLVADGSIKPVRNDESNAALQRFGTRNDRQRFELK